MALTPGARLGVYEVIASIGVGGMGEVFRARDTKLNRDVALKVLPDSFASDPDRLARFTREAQTLASLNHPHIAGIYGLEESGGVTALVMELIEGEDLSQRIARGAIPLDEAVPIAKQVAEALEAAHEQGIIHRDLKPANIKVRLDGTVKVLDFGLAKAMDPAGASSADAMNSPTMTARATQMGMILGTAAYMAPEQAKGKSVDKRADIWAFGVVLYEMLTGRTAFAGDTVTDIIAAVVTREPDWMAIPSMTPTSIRQLLARCLEKDPKRRLRDIGDVRFEFEGNHSSPATSTPSAQFHWWWMAVAIASAITTIFLAAMLWRARESAPAARPVTVAQIGAPPGVIAAFHEGFAVSPDGTSLAFAVRLASGTRQIWVRRLDDIAAHPLDGSTDGTHPFWSPDGAHIAFFASGSLRRVSVSGGSVQTICAVNALTPVGSWSDGGEILVADELNAEPILKVAASGGAATALSMRGRSPQWLPGGRQFLFAASDAAGESVQLASVDGGTPQRRIQLVGSSIDRGLFEYVSSGYFFANRGDALTAQRIEPRTMTPVGSPRAIAGTAGTPLGWFAVAAAGDSLSTLAGDPPARLSWVDRQGTRVGDLGEPAQYWTLRLAPDGRRAVVNPSDDLSILGATSRPMRIEHGYAGVWSPDGAQIAFQDFSGNSKLKRVDRETPAVDFPGIGRGDFVIDWSSQGTLLVMRPEKPRSARTDLAVYDIASRSTRMVVATPADEKQGRFSPDGRRIAYTSNASGQEEIYVRDITSDAVIPAPIGKGSFPVWRRDGRELFYLGPNDEMMAVEMAPGATQPTGLPKQLFRIPLNVFTHISFSPFDVSPDGQRFLLNLPETPTPLLYIRGLEQWLSKK